MLKECPGGTCLTKLFNNKMFQKVPRLLQANTLFNHLPRRLSQLGCPRQSLGHLPLVEDQNSMSSRSSSTSTDCTPTPSNLSFLQNHHKQFRAMSWAIFLSSSHHPERYPDSDSETYLHKKNWRSKPKLNNNVIKS
jgi:hypothetical protein